MTGSNKGLTTTSDYDAFEWCLNMFKDDFNYIVAMTRRSPNWLECVRLERKEDCPKFDIITENGLLMIAEELADSYVKKKKILPRIAIIDDVLVHGRSLNAFLLHLLDLLTEILGYTDNSLQREDLWAELCNSVTILICYANRGPFLLRHEFQWSMRLQYIGQEHEWRRFSADISNKIWSSGIANTSYVLSAVQRTADAPDSVSNWEFVGEDEISYRGARQQLYVHPLSREWQAFPTVRSYVCAERRYFTPYFFGGIWNEPQVNRIFEFILSFLQEENNDNNLIKFIDLMKRAAKYVHLKTVYFQLINLLLGQITLHSFFRDAHLDKSDFDFDTDKIAYNFGLAGDVGPILETLCKVDWPDDFLERLVERAGLPRTVGGNAPADVPPARLRTKMEHIIYQRAVQHEKYAKKLERSFLSGRETVPFKRTGEISFAGFLMITFEELGIPKFDYRSSVLLIACLTQMMDRGDVSLKARAERGSQGNLQFYSALRNTEMSLSILPRKMSDCFSDFYRLTHFYWRDDSFPAYARKYFDMAGKDGADTNEIADAAEEYARTISNNPDIISCLMDWEDVPLNP